MGGRGDCGEGERRLSGGSVVVTPAETTFVLTRQIRIEGVDVDVMVEVVADRLLGEGEVGAEGVRCVCVLVPVPLRRRKSRFC